MNLTQHYDQMRAGAIAAITYGTAETDPLLDSKQDTRRGITLLTRPPTRLTEIIETILIDFRRCEPSQYYYPATDIHLTVLSIISCYSGFLLPQINPDKYIEILQPILQNTRPFTIRCTGLTASPSSIIIQGFPQDNSLNELRDKIRRCFQNTDWQHSIDQRYNIRTAHSTVVRFRNNLVNSTCLLVALEKYRNFDFGSFEVQAVELVYNDWYQRAENTMVLKEFKLGKT